MLSLNIPTVANNSLPAVSLPLLSSELQNLYSVAQNKIGSLMYNLDKSPYSSKCLVVDFPEDRSPVEVVPHACTDLPIALTSHTAMWVISPKADASAYCLKGSNNNAEPSAIEYINDN